MRTVPHDAHISDKYPTTMSVMDIYRQEFKNKDKPNGGSKAGGFDTLVSPGTGQGKSPAQAKMDRDDDQWRTEIEAAMASAKLRGNLPGAFEEALGKRLEPQVSWQDQIVALFARRLGTGSYDFTRPDRRLITRNVDPVFAPGRRGTGCKLIVVVGDSSGSVTQPTAAHFFGEMSGILEDLSPETVRFAWCDTRVRGWEDIEDLDDLARVEAGGIKGRGGTDFRPPFRDIADMDVVPDCIVFLTDGDGPFPEDPGVPVIWGDISGNPKKYPFGDVVQIPVQA
jgi:predicted metal-dependent peptidase